MTRIIGTFFYIGYLKPAPGTWGSLAALPFVWLFYELGGPWLLGMVTILTFLAGAWATDAMLADHESDDPSEIVIDEVVGMWVAMWPVAFGAAMAGADILALYPGWIAAFLAFRLFDIWKPGPIGWADRRGGASGVMLDDVIAGAFAAVVTLLLAAISHLWLMG